MSIFILYVVMSTSNFILRRNKLPPFEVHWSAGSGRPTLNLERQLDHEGHPLAITSADAVTASGVPPWNWRETPGSGKHCYFNSIMGECNFYF